MQSSADIDEDGQSLSQMAYRKIRNAILSGVFAPDMPLRLEFLRERYGISFSPLREALNQLQAERLVASTSKRGFRVAPVSIEAMWEVINARILIESEALRQSIAHGDDFWEGNIVSGFHALDKCRQRLAVEDSDDATLDVLESRHQYFHTMLLAACPSTLLLQLSANLYAQTERYRRPLLSVKIATSVDWLNPNDDHRGLMAAALARDADMAAELLRRHLRSTGKFIEASDTVRHSGVTEPSAAS